MKALRQRVEQIVRPLRASLRTKDRMREELLAHLEALYAQHLQRAGDETKALDEARRQLGDPAQLTAELQDSVPKLEQWAVQPVPGSHWARRRPQESLRGWALRTTTAGSLASAIGMILVVMTLVVCEQRFDRVQRVAPFLLAMPVVVWGSLLSLYGCCELIRRQLPGDSAERSARVRHMRIAGIALLYMSSAAIAPTLLALVFHVTIAEPIVTIQQEALICLGWALTMGIILAIQARDWAAAVRRHQRWDSLELESSSAL